MGCETLLIVKKIKKKGKYVLLAELAEEKKGPALGVTYERERERNRDR
jgi:hypothetical protein